MVGIHTHTESQSMVTDSSYVSHILHWQGATNVNNEKRYILYIDGLVQERRNSIANALELRLPCTNPSISFGNKNNLVNDFR